MVLGEGQRAPSPVFRKSGRPRVQGRPPRLGRAGV